MPTVPKGDAGAFFPSGGEASGFRLPDRAEIIPRRANPSPRTRKLWFNGVERMVDDI